MPPRLAARPLSGWGTPTLTSADTSQAVRRDTRLVVQVAGVRPKELGRVDGLACTSAARTVADLLRHLPTLEAVPMADHALRTAATTRAEVVEVLHWQGGWPYAERGRTSLELVDQRRESWFESWSFVRLHLQGVPLPEPQVEVLDRRGRLVARVDGLWDDATVAEATAGSSTTCGVGCSPGPTRRRPRTSLDVDTLTRLATRRTRWERQFCRPPHPIWRCP